MEDGGRKERIRIVSFFFLNAKTESFIMDNEIEVANLATLCKRGAREGKG